MAAWTEHDQKTLIAMIEAGISAQRVAVRLKRPLQTVKLRAKALGKPFPHNRDLKRVRTKILNPPR